MGGIFAILWLLVMVAVAARAPLRRALLRVLRRRLFNRSLSFRVRVTPALQLRGFGLRFRLYGLLPFEDRSRLREAAQRLAIAIDGRPVRLRVVGRDADGTLVAVARCDGANLALGLLRNGLVAAPGNVARAYRVAMTEARCRGRGHWRVFDNWPPGFVGWHAELTPAMTYRYG